MPYGMAFVCHRVWFPSHKQQCKMAPYTTETRTTARQIEPPLRGVDPGWFFVFSTGIKPIDVTTGGEFKDTIPITLSLATPNVGFRNGKDIDDVNEMHYKPVVPNPITMSVDI